MDTLAAIRKTTQAEQKMATASYRKLAAVLAHIRTGSAAIEIEVTGDSIKVPRSALQFFKETLKAMSEGVSVSLVPEAKEMSTQQAAALLGCSRPHVVKLLEEGTIPYIKVGRHRRVRYEDVLQYRNEMKTARKQKLIDMMRQDEKDGLYDS